MRKLKFAHIRISFGLLNWHWSNRNCDNHPGAIEATLKNIGYISLESIKKYMTTTKQSAANVIHILLVVPYLQDTGFRRHINMYTDFISHHQQYSCSYSIYDIYINSNIHLYWYSTIHEINRQFVLNAVITYHIEICRDLI